MTDHTGVPLQVAALSSALSQPRPMRRGSVNQRRMKCGQANCACQRDPKARHGPYYTLTQAAGGKTRSRYVLAEQVPLLRRQIEAGREFRQRVEAYWEACEQWTDAEWEQTQAAVPAVLARQAGHMPPEAGDLQGTDMEGASQFTVIDLAELKWPTSLRFPSRRFRLLVAANASARSDDEISEFARAASGNGMAYLCTWGRDCLRIHDVLDRVTVENELRFDLPTPDDVIMITWHEHETLEKALDFFATCAVPTDGYAADSRYWLVICVGNPESAARATRFLTSLKYLI